MSDQTRSDHISKKRVVYRLPAADAVKIERDRPYATANSAARTMDLYYPPDVDAGTRRPAVVIVLGYSDAGYQKAVGCRFKEMAFTVDWARLIAASGMIAVAYTNEEPAADFSSMLQYVRAHAATLGIDERRVGLFGVSGSGPLTLSALMRPDLQVRCAAFGWAYLMDLDGASHVAEAAKQWRFANACEGRTLADIRVDVPIFIARAGKDQFAGVNAALDRFVDRALAANLPITLVNHATAPHAFDLFDDSDGTREIIG